ncbi:hypothetical protein [Devosia sp. RR2S18]|uniref:hypothetical protein n=1 Tax=Devosia rhizosphaerae TaxID=3049774 RepID=UPI002541F33E|nr:hypothetical protein [Devosia sp. RR2S18]WIJ24508.1 hypothetical protein QOV41_16005 [Devosia sp. RR2S18]
MNTFKVTLRSGQILTVEDHRSLTALATQLAHEGFVVVQRRATGYSTSNTELALMERGVESIEPAQ